MRFGARNILFSLAIAVLILQAAQLFAYPSGAPADLQIANNQAQRNAAGQLFALGNQARAAQGLRPLEWDPALAAAALNHCVRMASEGSLSHQYNSEPDLSERAGAAGAHFSLIEENIAEGYQPSSIHQAWMNSPHHRDNLLSPEVDRVGFAVVSRGNMLYAVADFEREVRVLTPDQVEATIASLMQANGITAHGSSAGARLACAEDHGLPVSLDNRRPEFIMRWQDAELSRLPGALLDRIGTGRYKDAAVGSCPSQSSQGTFTVYRIAVLLLRPEPLAQRTYISSK